MVSFYPVKFDTYESLYNHKDENGEDAKIQVEVLEEESDADPEGYEGYEGSKGCVTLDEDRDKENTTHLQDPSPPSPPRAHATQVWFNGRRFPHEDPYSKLRVYRLTR